MTTIRLAGPGTRPEIVAMIHELAAFENAADECTVAELHITAALFEDAAVASCYLAEVDAIAPSPPWRCGFRNFSTWDGVAGIHLEDLYVREEF